MRYSTKEVPQGTQEIKNHKQERRVKYTSLKDNGSMDPIEHVPCPSIQPYRKYDLAIFELDCH